MPHFSRAAAIALVALLPVAAHAQAAKSFRARLAGGKHYIAVSTGLGGGSPRLVPRTISPEIKHPNSGNAIYVFELPDKR